MCKQKEKRLPSDWKSKRKVIKARHDESTPLTEFEICVLRDDGKEAGNIGGGSFEGVNLEKATVMLTQLADAIGDCEIKWDRFDDVAEAEELRDAYLKTTMRGGDNDE
jgi:hypothetical protein